MIYWHMQGSYISALKNTEQFKDEKNTDNAWDKFKKLIMHNMCSRIGWVEFNIP